MEKEFLKDIVDTWGVENQIDMVIEEMSELTKALIKLRRSANKTEDIKSDAFNHVCEEIADVENMLEQMRYIFSEDIIDKYKKEKIERLVERLKNSKKKK